jgi:hypothetical protein
MDNDIKGLSLCIEGMELVSERMRRATIEFLWDKYILQPIRIARREAEEAAKTVG